MSIDTVPTNQTSLRRPSAVDQIDTSSLGKIVVFMLKNVILLFPCCNDASVGVPKESISTPDHIHTNTWQLQLLLHIHNMLLQLHNMPAHSHILKIINNSSREMASQEV